MKVKYREEIETHANVVKTSIDITGANNNEKQLARR